MSFSTAKEIFIVVGFTKKFVPNRDICIHSNIEVDLGT